MKKESVLYRAYRPQTFAEDSSVRTCGCRSRRFDQKWPHLARISVFWLARHWQNFYSSHFFRALKVTANDMYEIDAASNRGIDDIRELRDGVAVLPLESPVQSLHSRRSSHAFKGCMERSLENARRAAGTCHFYPCHNRARQGPGDSRLALPSLCFQKAVESDIKRDDRKDCQRRKSKVGARNFRTYRSPRRRFVSRRSRHTPKNNRCWRLEKNS